MGAGSSSNIEIALLMGPFLALVPALIDSSLQKRPIGKPWFLYCLSGVPIAFLLMQGKSSYLWQIVGIPVLILCAGAIVSGVVSRQKQASNPSPQLILKIILGSCVVAVAASYLGYSAGQKEYGGDEQLDAVPKKSPKTSSASQPVRDKQFYYKGVERSMTREQLIAEFGPPEIANDSLMAYKSVRPENGKETLCFFYFKWDVNDNKAKANELTC